MKTLQCLVRSCKLSQGFAYSRNASQCTADRRAGWLDGWLTGPLRQGSEEACSLELRNRLEGPLEALFMKIRHSPSNALLERWGRLPCIACRHRLDSNSVRLLFGLDLLVAEANVQIGAPGVFAQRRRLTLHFWFFCGKHFSAGRVPANSFIACRIPAKPLNLQPSHRFTTCRRVAWAWWYLGVQSF